MKKRNYLVIYLSLVSTLLLSMLLSTTLARYVKGAESGGSYGEVSIRSYYDSGKGVENDPFVITRPIHLYNLSRLQGLGVYSGTGAKKTYFQLGKAVKVGNDTVYRCYADDTSNTLDRTYLDMNQYSRTIEAIGSETTPFFGDFNGNNLEIRNLTVYADPQDAGLFGYTAHASKVYNLFLDNITIDTKGYSKTNTSVSNLYGSAISSFNASFDYTKGNDPWSYTPSSPASYADAYSFTVDWDEGTTSDTGPTVGYSVSYSGSSTFRYKLLPSGGLLTEESAAHTFTVDTNALIEFFDNAKSSLDATYPLTASSSMSILAYLTTDSGYLRSRVLLTLSFDFTLASSTSNIISLSVHAGRAHGNNIGLVIGHCDGTVNNSYVHDGKFVMNDGDANQYQAMANGSDIGLIGVHGNTVKSIASEDAGVSAQEGKTVGILDFSKIYKTVAGTNPTFTEDSSREYRDDENNTLHPYTYTPDSEVPLYYKSLLRKMGSTYYTAEANSITFKGQEVIQGTDLGVFKIATDHASNGVDTNAMDDGMAHTVVRKETEKATLYYSTGEYRKYDDEGNRTTDSFADYRDSIYLDAPNRLLLGHHFPKQGETTWESFEHRETQQNYFIRFQMDANRAGFYFSDLDRTTVGGSFLTKYLQYKLVDENNNHIYIKEDGTDNITSTCGITFKDNVTKQEISNVSASFATRDLSAKRASDKMWCINSQAENYPVANMINFNITTDWANVTIIAAPKDKTKPAALGIYKIGSNEYKDIDEFRYVNRNYDNPDYAFFMPADDHLAYFDYKVCCVDANGVETTGNNPLGRIGTYENNVFKQATYGTNATVPAAYGANEHGHTSGDPRLYVHTFKLPFGQYCIGSPTGTSSTYVADGVTAKPFTSSKIYYICAQGQDSGELDFLDNTFGDDYVDNIDFLKTSRANIKIPGVDTIGLGDDDKLLEKQRCYVMLAENDRSEFAASAATLSFKYEDGAMVIQAGPNNATLSAMTKVTVASYGRKYGADPTHTISDLTNTGVILFEYNEDDSDLIKYPRQEAST